jgi:hypothetical protein
LLVEHDEKMKMMKMIARRQAFESETIPLLLVLLLFACQETVCAIVARPL